MKKSRLNKWTPRKLLAIALLAAGGVLTTSTQAATALNGQLVLRPLTSVDLKRYSLPASTELSGGLSTVGIGVAVYLEAEVNLAIPSSNITSVAWSLDAKPTNSLAVLSASPLGTNVPISEPSSALVSQVAGRALLRPDLVGQYKVTATITADGVGTTNVSQTITAATYMGVQTCALCHSGGVIAPDKYEPWSQTLHHQIFADQIDGHAGPLRDSCNQCHTTGYNTNPAAVNGGFDDLAAQYGWTPPATLMDGNWASMQTNYPAVANLANVQCESCHGAGSQHAIAELNNPGSAAAKAAITVSLTTGTCNQCHDAADHHPFGTEWLNSGHAIAPTYPTGPGREACVGCHSSIGFLQRMDGITNNIDTAYMPINCQTCHEPHGETTPANNPHMIRAMTSVTLEEGTVVTNAGEGLLCMQCHRARVDAKTYASDPNNASSHYGPHHGPQGDMLMGVNGYTYDLDIPSSAHGTAVTNTCVTCHMQNIPSTDPAFTFAGGHTFKPAWETDSVDEDLVGACQQCHGTSVTSFDIALKDYNGDGVVEGVQTEVKHLLDKLSTLLPNSSGVVDGLVKTPLTAKTWTPAQMEAAYNYAFVTEDKSMGIHNTAYTVGLLKASIANLTDDANNDSLPDSWQTGYFGSINNPAAAPNAINNTAGVPNWMMYALGLAPTATFTVDNSGVIYFDGNNIVNGATDSIAIYTAAEVAFNTQVGTSYQIQGISELSGNWQNISTNIPGTGGSISYVVPTRNDAKMFFRVIHTP
ncbi:hypothetical protein GC207_09300 [bacterium]|nr:hypothetical protein [bacterium]